MHTSKRLLHTILPMQGWTHNWILDLWTAPNGDVYDMTSRGKLLRATPLDEHDPAPQPPESSDNNAAAVS